jgi:hypothetical protein
MGKGRGEESRKEGVGRRELTVRWSNIMDGEGVRRNEYFYE